MESEALDEEERRALRGSKFAPLPAPPPPFSRSQPRLAHPGGPMTTNKAAALAKFLERKLQQPGGLNSIDPDLLEQAVKNAKETVIASNVRAAITAVHEDIANNRPLFSATVDGASNSGRLVRHVASFHDSEGSGDDQDDAERKQLTKKKKRKVVQSPGSGRKKSKKKRKKKMVQSPKAVGA